MNTLFRLLSFCDPFSRISGLRLAASRRRQGRRWTGPRSRLAVLSGVLMVCPFAACAKQEPVADENQIPPLLFKGEPFFPMGTFGGSPDDAERMAAGANTAFKHVSIDGDVTDAKLAAMQEDLRAFLDRCEAEDVAAILYPTKINGRRPMYGAVDEAFRAEVLRFLDALLEVTGDHPQLLGYWIYDEPENHLWKEWKKSASRGSSGGSGSAHDQFAAWAVDRLGWYADTIREGDPDGYVMPTLAWWNMYEKLAPLVDVHVPNEYPTMKGDDPLTGSLYDVTYDAAKAAEAVRRTNVHSFLYMPGIFDIIFGDWRGATFEEMRYLWFAPLTQGARGFLGWRLSRASEQHRREVLYPVMREVDRFREWWLAPTYDHRVRSDRDTASVDYLREFPELIRTVQGETIERREVQGLPDVSYTLRRLGDRGWLLLAVNNRKEATPVSFQIEGLPSGQPANEALEGGEWTIENGRFSDELPPFGVRVYRF